MIGKLSPPLTGMTVVPEGYGTDFWKVCGAAAWFGLLEFAIGQKRFRDAFEKETGITLLIGRNSGADPKTMAAWCDWVTVNYWGVEEKR